MGFFETTKIAYDYASKNLDKLSPYYTEQQIMRMYQTRHDAVTRSIVWCIENGISFKDGDEAIEKHKGGEG